MMSGKREFDAECTDNGRSRSGSGRSVSNIVRKLSHRVTKKNSSWNKGNAIPPHCKFKLVVQTVKPELTVCFMLANTPGYALTCNKTEEVFAEKVVNDVKFWERCSFIPSANLWFDGFCAFESMREASRYLLFADGKFFFRKYDGTQRFKENASFLFNKEVQIFSPRRSQSNIIPPDPNRLCVLAEKPHRKFSLISFSSSPSSPLPGIGGGRRDHHHHIISTEKPPKESKTELHSLGYNQCYDCLTLTNFRYIAIPPPSSCEQSNTSLSSFAVSFPETSEESSSPLRGIETP